MRVEKVRVQNYLSVKDSNVVPFDDHVTVLVGKNDAGKTNFLKALETVTPPMKYADEDLCYYCEAKEALEKGKLKPEDIKILEIWFKLDREDQERLREISDALPQSESMKISKSFGGELLIEIGDTGLGKIQKTLQDRIPTSMRDQAKTLQTVLENHSDRNKQFSANKPQYTQFIQTFVSATQTPSTVQGAIATLFTGLSSLPNADEEISKDLKESREKLERISNSLTTIPQLPGLITQLMPKFIYLHDVDLLPDSVKMQDFLANKTKYRTLDNLLLLSGLDLQRLMTTASKHQRKRMTEEASVRITGEINKSWTQERVDVRVGTDGEDLIVSLKDDTGAYADPPSRRSEGFQWFLSFYINLMAGARGELKNCVLLLDGPASSLHPSGQKDVLGTIERMSETSQIVLATHSPFLIDRTRLDRVRIVLKRDRGIGTVVTEKFHPTDFDTLEVIRAAIGMTLGDALFASKKNLVVEGISDYYILEGLSRICQKEGKGHMDTSAVSIVPMSGADKIPYFILYLEKENFEYVVLFDYDKQGMRIEKELRDRLRIKPEKIVKLDYVAGSKREATIEDLLDPPFYNLAVNYVYKPFLEKKGIAEIRIDELPDGMKITKRYDDYFQRNDLGRFDKVLVARRIHQMSLDESWISSNKDSVSVEMIARFNKLFDRIMETLKVKV